MREPLLSGLPRKPNALAGWRAIVASIALAVLLGAIGAGVVLLIAATVVVLGGAGLLRLIGVAFGFAGDALLLLAACAVAATVVIAMLGWSMKRVARVIARILQHSAVAYRARLIALPVSALLGAALLWLSVPQSWFVAFMDQSNPSHPTQIATLPVSPDEREWLASYITPRAKAGDGYAQFVLAESYANGSFGSPRDLQRANEWQQRALSSGDFDAYLASAADARDPQAPPFGHVRSASEIAYGAGRLQQAFDRAPSNRKPAIALMLAERVVATYDGTTPEDAAYRDHLRKAASLGSTTAALLLAAVFETRNQLGDNARAHSLYAWSGAVYDTERSARSSSTETSDVQAEAQEFVHAFQPPLQQAEDDDWQKIHWRSLLRGTRERLAGIRNDARADGEAHGLIALEYSGYILVPTNAGLERYTALNVNTPLSRFHLEQRIRRGDCQALLLLGRAIASVEINVARGRVTTTDNADYAWAAAAFSLVAECATDANEVADARQSAARLTSMLPQLEREAVESRRQNIRSIMPP